LSINLLVARIRVEEITLK